MTVQTQHFFVLSPTSPAHQRLLEAEQFFLLGNLNEALAAAQQAWREQPQEPDVFRVLAYLHMARGEFPPAVQAARQAVMLDGNNPLSLAMLAQVYLTFDIYKQAREVLTQARERFPNDLSFVALLADLSFRQRQDKQAVGLAQQVLEQNPHDGYMRALLGKHFRTRRRWADAALCLGEAVQTYPQRADYQRDLGVSLLHMGQVDAARRCLARSLQQNPEDLSTKRYLFYAVRFGMPQSWYWQMSMFFFEFAGLGWILQIIGWIALLTGIIWLPIAAINLDLDWQQMSIPAGILVLGIMAIFSTASGIAMTSRRGERFDAYLHEAVERLQLLDPQG